MLEEESGLLPLKLRRKSQLSKYAVRVLSMRGHPVRDAIMDYYPFDLYNSSRYPLPVTGRIRNELDSMRLKMEHIATTPMKQRNSIPTCCCKTSLNVANKADLSCATWQLLFNNLRQSEYQDRTAVFSDGTKGELGAGFGVFSENFSLLGRLPDHSSVYTSELFAINAATKYISALPGNFVLWTDSLSCVTALQAVKHANHHLVSSIQEAISNLPDGKLIIEWVSSHKGIPGNTRADEIAKNSIQLQTSATWIAVDDAYRVINRHYSEMCRQHYISNRLFNKTSPPATVVPAHLLLPRRQQVTISRLRLRTCLLTHGHFFSGTPRRQCTHCSCTFDLKHLLIECPSFTAQRSPISRYCAAKAWPLNLNVLLDDSFPHQLLLQFLRDTNHANEI